MENTMTEMFYGPVEPSCVVHGPRYSYYPVTFQARPSASWPAYSEDPYLVYNPRDYPHLVYPRADERHEFPVWQARNENTTNHVQTLHFKVPMCCNKCEEKVKEEVLELDGVQGVTCDQGQQKVTVSTSNAIAPEKVLKRLKKLKKRTTFWPHDHCSACGHCSCSTATW